MSIFDDMEADLAHAEETFDQQVYILGVEYPCVISDFRVGESSDFEYTAGTADLEIRVRKGAVGSWRPTKGQQLTAKGESLQLESWTETSAGIQWVLFCTADHRR